MDHAVLPSVLHVDAEPLPIDVRELAVPREERLTHLKDIVHGVRAGQVKGGEGDKAFKSDQAFIKHGLKMSATRTGHSKTPTVFCACGGRGRCPGVWASSVGRASFPVPVWYFT